MDIFKIFKESFLFYRSNFKVICLIMLPVIIPENIVSHYIEAFYISSESSMLVNMSPIFVRSVSSSMYHAALIVFFHNLLGGNLISIKDALVQGVRFLPLLILTDILMFVSVGVGLLLFIIPGLIIGARLSLAEFFVVLENQQPTDALKSSFTFTQGHTWIILGALLAVAAPMMIASLFTLDLLKQLELLNALTSMAFNIAISIVGAYLIVLLFRIFCFLKQKSEYRLSPD